MNLTRLLPLLVCLIGTTAIPGFAQTPAVPSDKLGWDMAQDPANLTFAILIDGTRQALPNVTCQAPVNGKALCVSPLPAMTPGTHSLQVVAILSGSSPVESAPSIPLGVTYTAVVTPENVRLIKG